MVRAYESTIELEIERLESVPLTPEIGSAECYPFPLLEPSGTRSRLEFRTLVLENPYVRVAVAPDLGGRIVEFLDKRSNTAVLPELGSIVAGGPRGATLNGGIQIGLFDAEGQGERRNALGPVEAVLVPADDDDEPAFIDLYELATGTGLAWRLRVGLAPDQALIHLEFRLHNRTFAQVPLDAGLLFPSDVLGNASAGVAATFPPGSLVPIGGALRRGTAGIASFQTDVWETTLLPISRFGAASAASEVGVLGIGDGKLELQLAQSLPSGKVVLVRPGGETLEASVPATPNEVLRTEVGEVDKIVVLDAYKNVRLSWQNGTSAVKAPLPVPTSGNHIKLTPQSLQEAAKRPVDRAAAHVGLAFQELGEGRNEDAAHHLDNALLYAGDHPLIWWAKAITGRDGEDNTELLNAHYLAPLEPALRAESFLRQAESSGEPSPLVAPLADNPDAMVDVACLLLDAGLLSDLHLWASECLQHRETPMLRYAQAYAHLSKSGMEFEAADQVARASQAPINPPYPWRTTERLILERLNQRFPADARIADLLSLMDAYCANQS